MDCDRVVVSRSRLAPRSAVILLLRLCLGGVFIYASLHKITDVSRFSEQVAAYEVLPHWMVNAAAAVLPWLEFWTGVLLLMGVLVKACAILQSSLLLLFTMAMGVNMARDADFYCGCFAANGIVGGFGYWHILSNMLLLCLAGVLCRTERRRFSHRLLFCRAFSRQSQGP